MARALDSWDEPHGDVLRFAEGVAPGQLVAIVTGIGCQSVAIEGLFNEKTCTATK
jgi:hypothetical protein